MLIGKKQLIKRNIEKEIGAMSWEDFLTFLINSAITAENLGAAHDVIEDMSLGVTHSHTATAQGVTISARGNGRFSRPVEDQIDD